MSVSSSPLSTRGSRAYTPPGPYRLAFGNAKKRPWSQDDPEGNIVAVVAENKLSGCLIHERLSKCTPPPLDVLCYPSSYSGRPELRQAMASMLEHTFMKGISIDAGDIIVQAGAGSILDNLFWVISEPGRGVLIPAPYYPQFDKDLTVKCEMVPLPFELDESRRVGSVADQLSAAADEGEARGVPVSSLLLTNPNNPMGIVYSEATVLEALTWCLERGVHVISDEIYALSVWGDGAPPFESLEVIARRAAAAGKLPGGDDAVRRLVHIVFGLSKDFASSGLRAGCLHTRCKPVWQAIDGLSYYASVSGHTQHLLTEMLSDTPWLLFYTAENARLMRNAHGILAGELAALGIPFVKSGASLFVWLDLREAFSSRPSATWQDEEQFWEGLAYQHGVFLTPGFYCHAKEPGFFRMCFTWCPQEALPCAARRIRAAIDSFKLTGGGVKQ